MPAPRRHRKGRTTSPPPPAKLDRSYVASLVDKRWDLLAEYKLAAVRAEKAEGLERILDIVEDLHAHVHMLNASWPTETDREEDLENHRRISQALARTADAGAKTGTRDRRVSLEQMLDQSDLRPLYARLRAEAAPPKRRR
jgi:hypothetical protein